MEKVIDYIVASNNTSSKLSTEIKRLLSEGWHLHGSLCTVNTNSVDGIVLSQALIKYEEKNTRQFAG